MELITEYGPLDLPTDFSMTIEKNNPFLSGDGDTSLPVTLPSSPRNLAVIGHLERVDRAQRYTNKMPAILQVGVVQKQGMLVIDKVNRRNGIEACFAMDSSDLYVKSKNKTLKEIFRECDTEGVSKETFVDLEAAIGRMQDCYDGDDNSDYTVFPVAIAPFEVDGTKRYQLNNEVDGNQKLVWQARATREGDITMYVPDGYGIAPFLKLHRLLHRLFQCLGYTVTENCFDDSTGDNVLANLVVVHNCADALVRNILLYQDLVPSCTMSEFLEWMLNKFHVQPVVNSETKTVRIVTMEAMLSSTPDIDISGKIESDMDVQLNPSSRIVLTPTNSLDGTAPANESFDKLVEKYGGYVEADEDQWDANIFFDCLVLRITTGQFYALNRDLANGTQRKELLGTNHFTYDRANSENTEEFSQNDVMPLMLVGVSQKRDVCPFIGERVHYHTSYLDDKENEKQEIILCQKAFSLNFAYLTTGTTQNYIPNASNGGEHLDLCLTTFGLYSCFWQCYNRLILNNASHVSGRINYSLAQFMHSDTSRLKLYKGQRMLPVKYSAKICDRFGLTEAEMVLVKDYTDCITDTEITPSASTNLKWVMHFEGDAAIIIDLWDNTVTDWENTHPGYQSIGDLMERSEMSVNDISGNHFIGVPTYLGQNVDLGNHEVQVDVYGIIKYTDTSQVVLSEPIHGWETLTDVHIWFSAETA